jgi:hypothetical protein
MLINKIAYKKINRIKEIKILGKIKLLMIYFNFDYLYFIIIYSELLFLII